MSESHSGLTVVDASTGAEELEILKVLEQKRKQLDEEIARFRAQKEQEFKDFEISLRSRRRGNTASDWKDEALKKATSTPAAPPALSNGYSPSGGGRISENELYNKLENLNTDKQRDLTIPSPLPSPSIPPSTASHIAGASSTAGTMTPPAYERERDFHGLFTPAFLPLLDSKNASTSKNMISEEPGHHHIEDVHHKPKSAHPKSKRHSLNLHSNKPISPIIKPSSSLPSALRRTPSDGRSKHPKHVTFRLSDFTIVDPSSSYEELPTPEIPTTQEDIAKELAFEQRWVAPKTSSAQQHSIKKQSKLKLKSRAPEPKDDDDDDSFFAFDEDLARPQNLPKSRQKQTSPDEEISDADLDSGPYRETKQELISGSPAAASLPISIARPPPPRGLEGGMYSLR